MTVKLYWKMNDLPPEIDRSSLSNNGCGKEYASYIVVEHSGKILRVESSAMEPEDATFGRDLNWIPEAIREAYELGLNERKP